MSYNGSGTFIINSTGQPVVANTVISATVFNALTADLASGLTNCITKDGQSTPTANIPMGSNKITGLANGTLIGDAANLGQVQSTAAKLISITGTDTVLGTMSPTLTAYAAGQLFYFVASGANTGAVTLNIDALGAKNITRDGSTALAAGDINSGEIVVVIYDGTRFQMINAANSFGNTTINGTLTVTGNTGLQANVSVTSALSVGGTFAVTGAATLGSTLAVTGKSDLPTVSTASANAAVAVITDLSAAGASITSANVGTAVVTTGTVTNLTATSASVASVNAGVALLTTATVTDLTAIGASIASANLGNAVISALTLTGVSVASANVGVANITDLRATGASVTSANVGTAVITTGTVTNLTATSASVASANAAVALVTTGTVTNLTSTAASIASANVGTAVITTLTVTGASIASANAGNVQAAIASVGSANLGTAVITTGTLTNLTATSASVASVNAAVALVTTGTVTNLTSTAASIASANLGTAVITTLTAVQASIGSANLITARFLGSSSGYVGIQAAAAAGAATYTLPSADGSNGQVLATNGTGTLSWESVAGTGDVVGPASATDNAIARFDLTTGKLIQNSSVIVDDSGSITGVASLAAVTASITSANAGTAVITTGNLTFSGTAQRITGDMTTTTFANRLSFQTTQTNGATSISALPNGTGTSANTNFYNNSDPTNASLLLVGANLSETIINSTIRGTGTYLPMTFYTGGSERVRIDTSGNVGIGTASPSYPLDIRTSSGSANFRLLTSGTTINDDTILRFTIGGTTAENLILFGDNDSGSVGQIRYDHTTDSLEFYANAAERMRIDSSGNVGIGGTANAQARVNVTGTLPTSINRSRSFFVDATIPSGTTINAINFYSLPSTENASFTLTDLYHFFAVQGTKGASSTITNQYGFSVDSSLTGATNNYGFYSNIASGSNRWNFYAAGTADNYFAGNVGIGTASPGTKLTVSSGTNAGISVTDGTVTTIIYNSTGGVASIGTTSNHPVNFFSNNAARMQITAAGNIVAGASAALATTATDGFLYVPTCAGTPTGTPTAITGMAPIVVDTTNNKLYFYSTGQWRDAGP
jgi:hypothetical protein